MIPSSRLHRRFAVALGLLAVVATACDVGRSCTTDVTTLSSSAAEEDGSPVAELLALAVGEHRLTMDYEREDYAFIDVDPPEPTTELVLTVTYDGGEARFVDQIQERETDRFGEEVSCSADTLEIDAVAHLRSADGLLDEALEVTFVGILRDDGTPLGDVRFGQVLDPERMRGSATIVDVHPEDPEAVEFSVTGELGGDSVRGSWGGGLTYDHSAVGVTIASFWESED